MQVGDFGSDRMALQSQRDNMGAGQLHRAMRAAIWPIGWGRAVNSRCSELRDTTARIDQFHLGRFCFSHHPDLGALSSLHFNALPERFATRTPANLLPGLGGHDEDTVKKPGVAMGRVECMCIALGMGCRV